MTLFITFHDLFLQLSVCLRELNKEAVKRGLQFSSFPNVHKKSSIEVERGRERETREVRGKKTIAVFSAIEMGVSDLVSEVVPFPNIPAIQGQTVTRHLIITIEICQGFDVCLPVTKA